MNHEFHPCPKPIFLTSEEFAAEMAAQHEACEREHAEALARAAEQARAVAEDGPGEGDPETGLHSVAPAEAGAYPELAADTDLGVIDRGRDGPLPPQGRRDREERDEAGRKWRSIDFSPPRRALFLHHLAEQGNVRAACSRVQISPQAAYLARRRDPIFRAGWDAALVHSREHALQVLANQALEGVREQVWHRGELVGHRVRHDARLLLAHLGRLDARCQDARISARADRFDELLALVAGEDYAWALRDPAADQAGADDPILPVTRERHSDRAAAIALGADDEPEPLDHDEIIARDAAEAEWDDWGARVDAVGDRLAAGEEPVVAPLPGAADFDRNGDADFVDDEDGAGTPPFEVKSLGGVPPRPRRSLGLRRTGGAVGPGLGPGLGLAGALGGGAEFFARTPFGSSTCSAGTRC